MFSARKFPLSDGHVASTLAHFKWQYRGYTADCYRYRSGSSSLWGVPVDKMLVLIFGSRHQMPERAGYYDMVSFKKFNPRLFMAL